VPYNPVASFSRNFQLIKGVFPVNKPSLLGVVLCFVCCLSIQSIAQDKFTLEQVMSAPFPSDLVGSPAGAKVAWILSAKGARNVWIAEPPAYKGRQLTSYNNDDGVEIGELVWTPDGTSVIYTRGGDLDGFGENTNPRSNPEEPKQGIWMAPLKGGAPQQIAEGHSPVITANGERIFYIKGRDVWQVRVDQSEKPSLMIQTKGRCGSLHLSPDGSMLVFANGRNDHSFIGVYDFANKKLRYLDASVDRDSEPVWSPDSRQVAFIRIPATREAFTFGPKRTGAPWSIRVASATTGEGREIWKAADGNGSVLRAVVSDDQLFWSADNYIVFPWEKDGWTHLYSVSASSGKPATLLTPGEFEVEHVSLAPAGKEIVYSSNQGDIDHRHIWRVATAGGQAPKGITTGNGIEYSPIVLSDHNTVAFLRSDAKQPERASIIQGAGAPQDLASGSIPSEFPQAALVEPQQVIFSSADGMKIHGQLFMPTNLDRNKRHPALLFFHGGSRRQMLLGWHYNYYYRNSYAMNQYLANHGYIVLSVNYRSGIGYGMQFREALNYGATGGSEFQDVLGAGLYMRGRPEVDPARIGLWGGSYGGYLTAMGLSRASDLFAAGVDMHGVHDWNIVIRNFVPAYDPGARPDAARLAFESSPMSSVKTWRSPVLLIHGDDDRNVPFSETVHLVEALRNQGVEFEQLIFPDEIHDFLTHADWLRAYHASVEFFDKHLKK
jgi:dipeptidyl aminopeptidase/acylaminoacyl peptidase